MPREGYCDHIFLFRLRRALPEEGNARKRTHGNIRSSLKHRIFRPGCRMNTYSKGKGLVGTSLDKRVSPSFRIKGLPTPKPVEILGQFYTSFSYLFITFLIPSADCRPFRLQTQKRARTRNPTPSEGIDTGEISVSPPIPARQASPRRPPVGRTSSATPPTSNVSRWALTYASRMVSA